MEKKIIYATNIYAFESGDYDEIKDFAKKIGGASEERRKELLDKFNESFGEKNDVYMLATDQEDVLHVFEFENIVGPFTYGERNKGINEPYLVQ